MKAATAICICIGLSLSACSSDLPAHTHDYADISGAVPASALPEGVTMGVQACSGSDKVSGVDATGEIVCSADEGTAYAAGHGIQLAGDSFSVDTAVIQSRIVTSCSPGSCIRSVAEDGTAECEQAGAGPGMDPIKFVHRYATGGSGSQADPWQGAVEAAIASASNGDLLVFDGGFYFLSSSVVADGNSPEIVLYAPNRDAIILVDTGASTDPAFRLRATSGAAADRVRKWVFDGLSFRGMPDGGGAIDADMPYLMQIRNCEFSGFATSMVVRIRNGYSAIMKDCYFLGNASSTGYLVQLDECNSMVVSGVHILGGFGGIKVYSTGAQTHGVFIAKSRFEDIVHNGIYLDGCLGCGIEQCYVEYQDSDTGTFTSLIQLGSGAHPVDALSMSGVMLSGHASIQSEDIYGINLKNVRNAAIHGIYLYNLNAGLWSDGIPEAPSVQLSGLVFLEGPATADDSYMVMSSNVRDASAQLDSGGLKLPSFSNGNRPAPGVRGRVIYNASSGNLNIDTGAGWILPDGSGA
ncbi:MAG: right-handed parallel beta-helix repeat-containing protein [Deltaproteobacteria bacterium]|nr:right-handed parallel beta-helix repeat-containing protein [Deltaproteobacteria bacterium]